MNLKDLIGVDKLDNTIEFYYICLLGKYLKSKGKTLSLKDIDIDSFKDTIQHSKFYTFFIYAMENGFVVDTELNLPVFDTDEHKLDRNLFLGSFVESQPYFNKVEGNKLYINLSDTNTNNKLFTSNVHESAVIDMTAYLHIECLMTGKLFELYPTIYNVVRSKPDGITSLYYLSNSTLAGHILKFPCYTHELNTLSFNCWYFLGKEQGLLSDEGYTIPQKRERLRTQKYEVGNVVFLYERDTTDVSSTEDKIRGCNIAIIRGISDDSITLEKVTVNKTRIQKDREFERQPIDMQELWYNTELEVRRPSEKFNLTTIGIDYVMSNNPYFYEEHFITPVYGANEIELHVEQNGIEFTYLMEYVDAIFWILKDWDIPFNEELYINSYYKQGNTPVYYQDLLDGFGYNL
ncbi:hypothetical protein COF68_05280 [Bacillus toyonensis]|uniref:hypothetical protein n=1 Tax=Bacillus toyonensis TaxID=155322 RepID=UPI000BFCAEE0|nr:hypothetical protein [Bacillus toyonensis]PHE64256.1 hypothetical protein COF68_05280 [Bacillus toyonensis]